MTSTTVLRRSGTDLFSAFFVGVNYCLLLGLMGALLLWPLGGTGRVLFVVGSAAVGIGRVKRMRVLVTGNEVEIRDLFRNWNFGVDEIADIEHRQRGQIVAGRLTLVTGERRRFMACIPVDLCDELGWTTPDLSELSNSLGGRKGVRGLRKTRTDEEWVLFPDTRWGPAGVRTSDLS